MPNPWFRCYSEFADDPKVQMMSEPMQRRLIMLFCERCKDETFRETERAFHWRVSPQDLAETKATFIENGFIDKDWNIINWNRRQFISDSSTERVRKYREAKKQDETLHETDETNETVTVTAPDTDTEQIQKHKKPLASTAHAVPAERGKLIGTMPLVDKTDFPLHEADQSEWQGAYPAVDVRQKLREIKQWLIDNPNKRKTKKGIRRFINSWLAREQDKGGSNGAGRHMDRTERNIAAAREAIADLAGGRNRDVGLLGRGPAGERNGGDVQVLLPHTLDLSASGFADGDRRTGDARETAGGDSLSEFGDDCG